MSLTNMLLADSVSKGGPGSGPQGEKGGSKDSKDSKGNGSKQDKVLRERQGKINSLRTKYPSMTEDRAAKLVDAKNPHYEAYKF